MELVGGFFHLKNVSQIGSFPQVGVKTKQKMKPPPRKPKNQLIEKETSSSMQDPFLEVPAVNLPEISL